MQFDFQKQLIAAQDTYSLYYMQENIDIEKYLELVLNEFVSFFPEKMQEFFKTEMKKQFNRVLDRKLTNAQKLAIIKNIVQKQIAPQIEKYLKMELNEQGIINVDKSAVERQ